MHAAQFSAAERSYEARLLAEIEADDDPLTEDEAREQAKDENERTPAHFATWLSEAADNGNSDRTPQDMNALRAKIDDGDVYALTTGQLVAVLVAASQTYAIRALYELQERFQKSADSAEFIEGRAAEILAAQEEQEREAEGAHYDAMAERLAA
jgi:hypothetical protein